MIADHPTPKITEGGGVSFTISSRDYKGVMCIVISDDHRLSDGKQSSRELLRSGCLQQYASDGEK